MHNQSRCPRLQICAILTILAAFFGCVSSARATQAEVRTNNGTLKGILEAKGVYVFKGIPYAAPPVGPLRWKEPQSPQAWKGVRPAEKFGAVCMQNDLVPGSFYQVEFYEKPQPVSEDCLYLNVFTTELKPSAKRPVMFWIHGGGWVEGSGSLPSFDGSALALKGVVVVTINYRLGIFGFFAHPELTKESAHTSSGNYGMLDQIAALQWVQKNIANFGGDPRNVTIFGQSAGAGSVLMLSSSPLAKGLFHRGIFQSGAFFSGTPLRQAEQQGLEFANHLNLGLSALREMSSQELLKVATPAPDGKTNRSPFWPTVDGYFLTTAPREVFEAGESNINSYLTGSTSDEGTSLYQSAISADKYKSLVQARIGAHAAEFLALYPGTTDDQAWRSEVDELRDTMAAASRQLVRMQTKAGHKAYWYYFDRVSPGHNSEHYGAFHSSDLVFVFDRLDAGDRPWEPLDRKLADTMSSYWANFAKNGDPNGPGLPDWPAYDRQNDESFELGNSIGLALKPDRKHLDAVDQYEFGMLL